MGDLKTSIILDLAGNLQRRARQFGGSLQRLGRQGSAGMRLLSRGAAAAGRGLDRLGSRYTALITGAAGVGAARMVGNLEERFTRLGIQSSRSAEAMDDLKKKIFETAKAPEIRVDPGRITAAVEEIIEKTGDLQFAQDNIRNIGLALQATGADGQSIGGILAEFQKMGMGAREAFEALDILTVQGKSGAFTLQNLAALGPRVVTAYTAMGRSGVTAMREMGAVLQVIRQGAGSPEQAATSFEALMRVLSDAKKVEVLQKGGIKIFEPKELEKGRKILRPINKIMAELVEKTKGDRTIINRVLGDSEAGRAFNAAISEFIRSGGVESLDKFYNVQADGSTITRDSARAARTFNAALTNLYTVWQQFADNQLAKPIKDLTDYLDGLKPGTVERWLQIAKNIALIGAGGIAAKKMIGGGVKAYQWGRSVLDMTRKRGKGRGLPGAGGLSGGFGDAVPVYVVNGPASIWNAKGKPGARAKGKAARLGRNLAGLAKRGPGGLLGAGKGLNALRTGISVGAAGAGTTALAATAAGAAGYGVGALLNRGLGALSGLITGGKYSGKGWLGEMIYDAIHGSPDKPAEVGGTIKLEIEGAPVRVKQMRSNNRSVDYEVDSGLMMVGP